MQTGQTDQCSAEFMQGTCETHQRLA